MNSGAFNLRFKEPGCRKVGVRRSVSMSDPPRHHAMATSGISSGWILGRDGLYRRSLQGLAGDRSVLLGFGDVIASESFQKRSDAFRSWSRSSGVAGLARLGAATHGVDEVGVTGFPLTGQSSKQCIVKV